MKIQLAIFALVAFVAALWQKLLNVRSLIDTSGLDALRQMFPTARVSADANMIETLEAKLVELQEKSEAIQAKADKEKRALSDDETKEIEAISAEFSKVEADLNRREAIAARGQALSETRGRRTGSAAAQPITTRERAEQDPKFGFNNFGEYALAVRAAAAPNAAPDKRLVTIMNAPTTFGSEGVGADGGILVPTEFRNEILVKIMGEDSLLARTDQMSVSGNSIEMPKDEIAPWDGTNGVQAYWDGEADQLTQSKFKLEPVQYRLNKLTALVPVTDELLEDAPSVDGYLRRKVPAKFTSKLNTAIFRGTGVGMPLGFLSAPATIEVAKETSQVANTIVAENIFKMYSRMYGPCRKNAVWFVNQDCEPQLQQMSVKIKNVAGSENVGGWPIYMPPTGLSQSPYATLYGRPVIPIEDCSTLGTVGDIVLADMSQYLSLVKAGGIKADVSMHLWFDYSVMAFRFVMRVTGAPWWASSITPKQGSNTRSCFVKLATRA